MRGMGKATLAVNGETVEGGRSLKLMWEESEEKSNLWLIYSFRGMMMADPLKIYADRTLHHICRQACLLRCEVN